MSLSYGGKRGDSGYNGDGDERQKRQGDGNEEQKACYFVREGVGKAAAPVHHEGRKLIHDFDYDNYSCPQP